MTSNSCTSTSTVSDSDGVGLCTAADCKEEVFVACLSCSGFLCQQHFDEDNPCSEHNISTSDKTVASESDFREVADQLEPDDLQHLFHNLGIQQRDIKHAEKSADTNDTRLKAMAVLRWWKQRKGRDATLKALLEAKRKISSSTDIKTTNPDRNTTHITNIHGNVHTGPKTQVAGDQINTTNVYCQPHHVSKDNADTQFNPKACQKRLCSVYKHKAGWIGFIPGMPKNLSMDKFFAELELVKEENRPLGVTETNLCKYTDLLEIKNGAGQPMTHMIVRGFAAIGKTTLISKLANQWASAIDQGVVDGVENPQGNNELRMSLNRYELVFALDIFKVTPHMDLVDVIHNQLLANVSKEGLKHYLQENSRKCLFLFDGYDELKSETKVFHSHLLPEAAVVVTTRPHEVHEFNNKYTGYVQVNLKGFSETSVSQFMDQFFEVGPSSSQQPKRPMTSGYNTCAKLKAAISATPALAILKHFPLLLAMMCMIWRAKEELPKTRTALYQQSIDQFARHWWARVKSSQTSFKQFREGLGFDAFLRKLGETALEGLFRRDTEFNLDEFHDEDVLDKGCNLGLVFRKTYIPLFDEVVCISFIHRTFQEFCAASYWANLAEVGDERFESYLCQIHDTNCFEMEYLLRFCCGISSKAALEIIQHVLRKVDATCRWDELGLRFPYKEYFVRNFIWCLPFLLLFETENRFGPDEVCCVHDSIDSLVSELNVNSIGHNQELQAIVVDILENKKVGSTTITWLDRVKKARLHVYSEMRTVPPRCEMAPTNLLQPMRNLNALHIIGHGVLPQRVENATNPYTALYSHFNPFNFQKQAEDACCQYLDLEFLKRRNIQELTIESISFRPQSLCQFLYHHPELQQLRLHDTFIDPYSLGQVTNGSLLIEVLEVTNPRKPITIIPSPRFFHKLEELSLDDTKLGSYQCTTLFQAIIHAGTELVQENATPVLPLRKLSMKYNTIGDAAMDLGIAFHFLTSLQHLNFFYGGLDHYISQLAPLLVILHNLEYVNLGGNEIGRAMTQLTYSLKKLEKLKVLKLPLSSITAPDLGNLTTISSTTLLTELDFIANKILADGAHLLASFFQFTPFLTSLSLVGSFLGPGGTQVLCESFHKIPHLTELLLDCNHFETQGATALAKSLSHTPSLQKLGIRNNDIGVNGIAALAQSFQCVTKLKVLEMSGNVRMNAQCADVFYRNIVHLDELTLLEMDGVNVSIEDCSEMPLLKACLNDQGLLQREGRTVVEETSTRNSIQSVISVAKKFL